MIFIKSQTLCDSSSYKKVAAVMKELYGESYQVVKEDCVGHIQKRMGNNLRTYKKTWREKNCWLVLELVVCKGRLIPRMLLSIRYKTIMK